MFPGLALDLPVSMRLKQSPQAFALALGPIRTNMQPVNAASGCHLYSTVSQGAFKCSFCVHASLIWKGA
jgi:hypothetical protein